MISFKFKKLKNSIDIKYDIFSQDEFETLNKINTNILLEIIQNEDKIEQMKHYTGKINEDELVIYNTKNEIILNLKQNFRKLPKKKKIYGEKFIKTMEELIKENINRKNNIENDFGMAETSL